MWCVWRGVNIFKCLKSQVRLGDPSCLATTTMRCCQLVGVFRGTLSMTPRSQSRSKPALTGSCQLTGTCAGTCTATGLALESRWSLSGGLPCRYGSFCCVQLLNDDEPYLSNIHAFNFGMFVLMGGYGMEVGRSGDNVLFGQEQLS